MLARAIIHAINNAEMRELALRITSLLDFLPLYDVDCRKMAIWNMTPIPNRNGNITCSTIIWRCFTALKMKSGKEQFSGAVVKTREATPGKEIEAITRRMLDFEPTTEKTRGCAMSGLCSHRSGE